MVHHGAGQGVETDKVRQLAGSVGILHHETLDDVLLGREPVQNVGGREDWSQVKPVEIIIEQLRHVLHICWPKLSNAWSLGVVWQPVELQVSLHGHVPREVTELHVNEFLGVDRAMPVSAGADRFGEDHACSVDSLEYSLDVHSTCDLSDQDRSQSFRPQLLVYAEEVDLDHVLLLVVHPDVGRDGRDEANQLVALNDPDAAVPFLEK